MEAIATFKDIVEGVILYAPEMTGKGNHGAFIGLGRETAPVLGLLMGSGVYRMRTLCLIITMRSGGKTDVSSIEK